MHESAIKQIQDTAIAATEIGKALYPVVALPEKMRLESLEEYQEYRYRFCGSLETSTISSFIGYVSEHEGKKCFIDKDKMEAQTIFDLGTIEKPGHGVHRALLGLEKTELYKAVLRLNGERMNQKDMAEFLEDYKDSIIFFDSKGETIPAARAITAVRCITIEEKMSSSHKTEDFSASRSAMEEVEASGKDGGLPAGFIVTCEPYNGLEKREFKFRLSLLTNHSNPMFVGRIIRLEKIKEDMAEEFADLLTKGLGEDHGCSIYIGRFTS